MFALAHQFGLVVNSSWDVANTGQHIQEPLFKEHYRRISFGNDDLLGVRSEIGMQPIE